MKIKTAVAILLVTLFALSSIATITIKPARASGGTLTLSDAELMLPNTPPPTVDGFYKEWGDGTCAGRTDVPGPGVQFDFTGLGKVGLGDKFVLSALAGGTGNHNGDFAGFGQYSMLFTNLGPGAIAAHLMMNTGWTDEPPDYGARDTFWASNWVDIGVGQSVILTLNFSSCGQVYNAMDDLVPEWRHPDGSGGWPVQRLDQVSNIGFEVASWAGPVSASVIVSGTLTKLYIDPPVVNKTPTDLTDFTVAVTLKNFANLYGFEIKLTWESTYITFVSPDTTPLNAIWPDGWTLVIPEESTAGSYRLIVTSTKTAKSGAGDCVLFRITLHVAKSSNFPVSTAIHFDVVKLSDNGIPIPNPIYAEVTDGTYYMSATVPDLDFALVDPTPTKPFEYCKTFEVEVYATHIFSQMTDFDLTIQFNSELLEFMSVDYWGVFGSGTFSSTIGAVNVVRTAGAPHSGDRLLLFALTFHIKFDDRTEHIWRKNSPQVLPAQFSIKNDVGDFSFVEGTIPITGITLPTPLPISIHLIRGDVDCNGKVNIDDISTIAYHYNELVPPGSEKYDLTQDGIIDIYDIVTAATNFGYGMP